MGPPERDDFSKLLKNQSFWGSCGPRQRGERVAAIRGARILPYARRAFEKKRRRRREVAPEAQPGLLAVSPPRRHGKQFLVKPPNPPRAIHEVDFENPVARIAVLVGLAQRHLVAVAD